MQIEWNIRNHLDPQILSVMQEAADQCLCAENISIPCMIDVCLCDDETIRSVNRIHRDIDRSTDVLSFPSVNYPVGRTAGSCERLLRQEYDADSGAVFLGDNTFMPRRKNTDIHPSGRRSTCLFTGSAI